MAPVVRLDRPVRQALHRQVFPWLRSVPVRLVPLEDLSGLEHQRGLHTLQGELLLEVPEVPADPGALIARLLPDRPVFPWLP